MIAACVRSRAAQCVVLAGLLAAAGGDAAHGRSADAGSAEAAYALARHYGGFTGKTVDRGRAHAYTLQAAERGHVAAQLELAFSFFNGNDALPRDLVASRRWFTAAAERGSPAASCMLGDFHRHGFGGAPQSHAEANRWYALGAESQDRCAPKAQYELYVSYSAGKGVRADLATALAWLEKAAQANHPPAQAALARHYALGAGVAQDPGLAAIWRRRSREGVAPHEDHDHAPRACPPWLGTKLQQLAGCGSTVSASPGAR
jgi:uncharacterized protein